MGEPRRCWLRWHNYSDSVTSALESLRYDEDFLDVTLACDGHTVRAHKLVLSACSAYFRKVLKDHPCDHPIIMLEGLGWHEVGALLHFMYCGQVVVEETHLAGLLNAAATLSVTGLAHVTSALASTQVAREVDSEDEDFEDEEEEEMEEEGDTEETVESTSQRKETTDPFPKCSKKREVESSEGDSSYDSDAPPAKRQRSDSLEAVKKKKKKCKEEPHNVTTATIKKGRAGPLSPSEQNVVSAPTATITTPATPATNGLSLAQGTLLSTPTVAPLSSDSSDKENEKTPRSVAGENQKSQSFKIKLMNGDPYIKEEAEDMVEVESLAEVLESGLPENGESEAIKAALSLHLSGEGVKEGSGVGESGGTSTLRPMSYVSFLSPGTISSSNNPTKPATTTIILPPQSLGSTASSKGTVDIDKVVQQVLLPASVSLQPGATTLTSTLASLSTTPTTLPSTTSVQPYVHPSLVSGKEVQATLEQYQRKLAFHEPRPCPTCNRMYRDAATLRTHMAIMHAEGKEPFACTCGALFRTKYDMYQHKKNGHR